MPRHSSGSVYEQPIGSGRWHAKFTTTRGRRAIRLLTCKTEVQAQARCAFISEHLKQLRAAGREDFANKLLELAGKAELKELDRIARGVQAIASGDFERPNEPQSPLAPAPTFKEFAERWTSGELHRSYPDHVKRKDSVDDDCYRLTAHLFPIIGDVALTDFKFEHADLAMRSLPPELSSGSRRHIAQLISRILRLAVYPGRIIEQSPIPKGFLPKPHSSRAQAWLYPAEESRLLAKTSVPLSHRLLYGVLAREGMRTSEAGLLTWGDLDLERGAIALDENKTDDPRAWMLNDGVTRALIRWRALTAPDAKKEALVFSIDGSALDIEHLSNTFRTHLASVDNIRPLLFQSTKNRSPIRAHDLRATFVTIALATGQTETWVADRTGHKSSTMINRYRRAARMAAELNLGSLQPLDEAIPELAAPSADTKLMRPVASAAENEMNLPAVRDRNVQTPGGHSPANPNSVQLAPRATLIVSLTSALRDFLLQGDHAGAGVALTALRELLALDQLTTPAGTASDGLLVREVVHLDLVRKDAGR